MTDLGPQTYQSMWKGAVPNTPAVSMKSICHEVADKYGIDAPRMIGRGSARHIAWPRQEFMWRCRQVKWADGSHRYSYPQIGRFLGGMDHSTVIHGERRHEQRMIAAGEINGRLDEAE